MINDDTQTAQLRRTIINSVDNYDLQLLKRIAYECRCEEMGINPDGKFLYTDIDWWLKSHDTASLEFLSVLLLAVILNS